MRIQLAKHYGMCFGVRDALRATHKAASEAPVTMLGQLVHNPVVSEHLKTLGVRDGDLDAMDSATTRDVVITAHGASDRNRKAWRDAGYQVTDTTCPLVHKAHKALARLVSEGYFPVVIGKAGHVEVRGLIGDFPQACVIESASDICELPFHAKIGIVSQTTQQIERVRVLVRAIQAFHPESEVRFVDTVCQPTKDRQTALVELCQNNEVVVVVGGKNSNNTHQLVAKANELGARGYHVEHADEVRPEWLVGVENVGVTAGTSTLDESVRNVVDRLKQIAAEQEAPGLLQRLAAAVG
ncbi:MAG: 4-hydroxy-3-methylbut-2-enyl diphosphate reductase [Verrucomicrobiae bacterium]|nr:4-hydroxy-3-methylbut-2-enyl diphosphate reductase [Verrucomicrobiae bacterium]